MIVHLFERSGIHYYPLIFVVRDFIGEGSIMFTTFDLEGVGHLGYDAQLVQPSDMG